MIPHFRITLFISICFISFNALAYEFKHFKLKKKMAKKFLSQKVQANNIDQGVQPQIIQRINQIIGNDYNQIGANQAIPLALNHDIGGGILNFSGFTWNKPAGNINISVNREVAPDYQSNKQIVHDSLTIDIDANSYITSLREAGEIEIQDQDLAAFIGLGFKRVYHYYHLANSYKEGITSDYSKLFKSFQKFNVNNSINIPPYHMLKKEDNFYFNAGGYVTTPPVNGVSLMSGAMVDIAYKNTLIIQTIGPKDSGKKGEFIRLSGEKNWNIESAAQLSLQLDFFNLLKVNLLEGELKYSYGQSHKQNLTFYEKDIDLILKSYDHHKEYAELLKGHFDKVNVWKKNIVQLEDRKTENLTSRFSVLIFGSIRKKETQQVRIIKDGKESIFYKHYSQSTKYIQNFLSRLFNRVLIELLNFNLGVRNFAESSKKMEVEYKYLSDIKKETVKKEEQFSLSLTQRYQAGKTHRWIDRTLKKNAVRKITQWSNLDRKIASMIKNKELRGPLDFKSKLEIQADGLRFFHSLNRTKIEDFITTVCDKSKTCKRKLESRYNIYNDHYKKFRTRDLKKFRRFIGKYFFYSNNIEHIQNLFGVENIFIHGSFFAQNKSGIQFSTYFKTGQFKGLGVIDTFTRQNGTTVKVK